MPEPAKGLELCGPVKEKGEVLIFSSFSGWRVSTHSEHRGRNEIDKREEYDVHTMRIPPGLSYQSAGLWEILTRAPGGGPKDRGGAMFELVDEGHLTVIEDFGRQRENRAKDLVAATGSIPTLEKLAELDRRESVIGFIREQIVALKQTGDASSAARKLQRAHNRSR